MLKNVFNISVLCLTLSAFAQPVNRSFESRNGSVNLLGQATLERFRQDPFQEWFNENYDAYEVNELIKEVELPDSITLFMGTWCGDSRREVPRFIKILEQTDFDMNKLKVVCLNTGFQNYKQAPDREERGMSVHRVPTFVMHDEKGEEIGRLVEHPVVSLEQDISDILSGKPYRTAYPVADDLIKQFSSHSLKEMRKMMPDLLKKYQEQESTAYELNTYGYILWTSFDLLKAEFVFELNSKLHDDSATPYATLASFKSSLGKEKEFKDAVKKGLVIDPEHKRLISMKEDMEK